MSISKNVIRDLLPVYAAGEASEETRALVDEACADDPELRAEVSSLGAVPMPDAAPPAELGIASLRRTQKLLRERTFLVGFCFYFTMLPVAFLDRPFPAARLLATLCLAVAIAGWGAFLRNSARLQATGLEPPRTQWPVMAWQVGAWVFSFSAASVVGAWMGGDFLNHPNYAILFLIWAPIMLLGRKLNQYREPEAIFRTETLFTLTREAESKEE